MKAFTVVATHITSGKTKIMMATSNKDTAIRMVNSYAARHELGAVCPTTIFEVQELDIDLNAERALIAT